MAFKRASHVAGYHRRLLWIAIADIDLRNNLHRLLLHVVLRRHLHLTICTFEDVLKIIVDNHLIILDQGALSAVDQALVHLLGVRRRVRVVDRRSRLES